MTRSLVLALALSLLMVACNGDQAGDSETREAVASGAAFPVKLFFPGEDGRLHAQTTLIESTDDASERVRLVVEGLLAGPENPDLTAPMPEGVTLDSILINEQGVVYLDFRLANSPRPPISGSRQELLSVYSIVDSVLMNVTELRSVAVLWNGQQRTSFAGHVDTSRPLLVDTSFVVDGP